MMNSSVFYEKGKKKRKKGCLRMRLYGHSLGPGFFKKRAVPCRFLLYIIRPLHGSYDSLRVCEGTGLLATFKAQQDNIVEGKEVGFSNCCQRNSIPRITTLWKDD